MNPHFKALDAAYQLRFYLCLKTKYLKPTLATPEAQTLTRQVLAEVCERRKYHLLETQLSQDHLRLLISLRPHHTVAETVRMLKGNLQYRFGKEPELVAPLAKGYFARSVGTVEVDRVRKYVDNQVAHHGYQGDWTKPLNYVNEDFVSPAFNFAHNVSMLDYQLVFVTQDRRQLFDESMAPRLFEYLLAIGRKHHFVVDRIGLLPDHLHLLIEGIPSVSVEQYAFAIMNNTRYWMERCYVGVLKQTKGWDVWRPSYYAGTVGEFTTVQLNHFLRFGGEGVACSELRN
jgi:REP element-mobilizing transposase RayT